MKEWFKTASATFAGGAVAIGLLAVPTFVWLPREFDSINSRLDAAIASSSEASTNSALVLDALEVLSISIARADAEQINSLFLTVVDGGISVHDVAPEYISKFVRLFPETLLMSLYEANSLSDFHYSDFAQTDWVFIERDDFLALNADKQRQIEEILTRAKARFNLGSPPSDLRGIFPPIDRNSLQ